MPKMQHDLTGANIADSEKWMIEEIMGWLDIEDKTVEDYRGLNIEFVQCGEMHVEIGHGKI